MSMHECQPVIKQHMFPGIAPILSSNLEIWMCAVSLKSKIGRFVFPNMS